MIGFMIGPYRGTFDQGAFSFEADNETVSELTNILQNELEHRMRFDPGRYAGWNGVVLHLLAEWHAMITQAPEPPDPDRVYSPPG